MLYRITLKMMLRGALAFGISIFFTASSISSKPDPSLLEKIARINNLSGGQVVRLKKVFNGSTLIGQGNPDQSVHPVSRNECRDYLNKEKIDYESKRFEKICGSRFMAPLYNPDKEEPESANVCIDQFEFPNIPCEYPLVWVRAREAAEICDAMGKRLCDAHEWEGACAGSLSDPDYRFDLAQAYGSLQAISGMRIAHNRKYRKKKTWSYGRDYVKGICATSSFKTPGCGGGSYETCGSNTFPSGYFRRCKSKLQVYDLHGNAAEHMNLPLAEDQMSSRGSETLGFTEMKGSWFIFDTVYAHEDWCRWRAPHWHGSRVMDKNSHRNYHLGFRCCKTLNKQN